MWFDKRDLWHKNELLQMGSFLQFGGDPPPCYKLPKQRAGRPRDCGKGPTAALTLWIQIRTLRQ